AGRRAGRIECARQAGVLDAVEARRWVAGEDQRRLEVAVQVETPRRAIISRRRVVPDAASYDRCTGHGVVLTERAWAARSLLKVRNHIPFPTPVGEEVVHVYVATLGLRPALR